MYGPNDLLVGGLREMSELLREPGGGLFEVRSGDEPTDCFMPHEGECPLGHGL